MESPLQARSGKLYPIIRELVVGNVERTRSLADIVDEVLLTILWRESRESRREDSGVESAVGVAYAGETSRVRNNIRIGEMHNRRVDAVHNPVNSIGLRGEFRSAAIMQIDIEPDSSDPVCRIRGG